MADHPAALRYSVTPTVVPHSEGAAQESVVSLMFCVTNDSAEKVMIDRIVFRVPTGAGSGDLAAKAPFPVGAAKGVGWTPECDDGGFITLRPDRSDAGVRAGESLAFFAVPTVNARPGMSVIRVSDRPDSWSELLVSKRPPGLAITSFQADPAQVVPEQASVLSWATTGATVVELFHDGERLRVDPVGWLRVTPSTTTLYTLAVSDQAASVSEQVTVYVPQVAIQSFDAEPEEIAAGEKARLSWLVANAEKVWIRASGTSPDPGEVHPVKGFVAVYPTDRSTTYSLKATGFGGSLQSTATVDWFSEVEVFAVSPSQIPYGGGRNLKSVLRWKVASGTGLSIRPGIGPVASEGSIEVRPVETTEYVLTGKRIPATTATVVTSGCLTLLEVMTDDSHGLATIRWASAGGAVVSLKADNGAWEPVDSQGWRYVRFGGIVAVRAEAAGWLNEVVVWCGAGAADVSGGYVTCGVDCAYGISASGATARLRWDGSPQTHVSVFSNSKFEGSGGSGEFEFPVGSGTSEVWRLRSGAQSWFVKTVRAA